MSKQFGFTDLESELLHYLYNFFNRAKLCDIGWDKDELLKFIWEEQEQANKIYNEYCSKKELDTKKLEPVAEKLRQNGY